VTLIGSVANIQAFLNTDGNLRYSVVNDAWLKVSLASARLATTTDGVRFTTVAYTAESVEAVRLVASAASGSGSTAVTRTVAADTLSGLFAQASESDVFEVGDGVILTTGTDTHLVEESLGGEIPTPGPVAVGEVDSATPHDSAVAPVKSASTSISIWTAGQPYRVVTPVSVPLDQSFSSRMGQEAVTPVSRLLSVVGGDRPVSVASVQSLNLEEPQTNKETGQRLNRSVRGVKGVSV
jgi:hypothetical protein